MSNVPAVTDATFDTEVLQAEGPVLVDIWATWCAPCRRTEPIIEELAAQHGDKIKFVKLDADANTETVTKYGVVSIPTFNLYAGGEVVKSLVGAQTKKQFLDELAEYL
ncbi:thioredoxin-1 [Cellulomonas hominis]|uniref:Thioredoxin n=1 Tax=Cellulomonas hominis TaxID=156981 RepID=A0A511FFY2_9CELL|nr:thioredoxin [Cellulomonas hominis]MBB5475127.1 thioredoxin 1 [Cellulomonas hominis]NKY05729.1 thioredoxin [Cellulomonas hominis]NKY11605.1 thioredoxin [Cellulomonas hominis]GEL48159.1 thioredoxin-1 [Cellulomonas hominis]